MKSSEEGATSPFGEYLVPSHGLTYSNGYPCTGSEVFCASPRRDMCFMSGGTGRVLATVLLGNNSFGSGSIKPSIMFEEVFRFGFVPSIVITCRFPRVVFFAKK